MSKHMQRELAHLEERLLEHCAAVEKNVALATRAIQERDEDLANEVKAADADIDLEEVAIEEECLKVLALHQPVAIDLRFIVAALKINNDLERISDLAANIARRALKINREPALPDFFDFGLMAEKTMAMLRNGVDAMVRMDVDLAHSVCAADDDVDRMNRAMFEIVERRTAEDPSKLPILLHYLSVSRQLERIADHATNIAEDVIYMITGEIVRHEGADATRG